MGVVPDQEARIADQREPFLQQVADGLGHDVLHLADVVGDAREQLAGRAPREKPCRLLEHVRVQPVAQVAHDALADIGHQVIGKISAEALEEVRQHDDHRRLPDLLLPGQHAVEDDLDLQRQRAEAAAYTSIAPTAQMSRRR